MPLKPYQKQSALTRIEEGQLKLSETLEKLAAPKQDGKLLLQVNYSDGYNVCIAPHQIVHIYASKNTQKRPNTYISVVSNGDQEEFDLNAEFDAIIAAYDAAIRGETVDLRAYHSKSKTRLKQWPIETQKPAIETVYIRSAKAVYR